jgi:hypothetical protein
MVIRAARSVLADVANHPVKVVRGNQPPQWAGKAGYHTTLSGKTVVQCPKAYGWPTVYHLSTLHITVGRGWGRNERLKLRGRRLWGRVHYIHSVTVSRMYARDGAVWICTSRAGDPYHSLCSDPRKAASEAIRGWKKQRKAKLLKQAEDSKLTGVYVDIEDSVRAGNCQAETTAFAKRIWGEVSSGNPCAVRADLIIAARDDSYTRRAVAVAMQH